MSLFNKKNLKSFEPISNEFNISEKDMVEDLNGFPVGVVVRMMESQREAGNYPNIAIFQEDASADCNGGFFWSESKEGTGFWQDIILNKNFNRFFEKYPYYIMY